MTNCDYALSRKEGERNGILVGSEYPAFSFQYISVIKPHFNSYHLILFTLIKLLEEKTMKLSWCKVNKSFYFFIYAP